MIKPLTTVPSNLTAVLEPGCHLVQAQVSHVAFYGAVPANDPDPVDTSGMFYIASGDFFVVNVGTAFDPVWVAGQDIGAGPGELVIGAVP